MTPARSPRWLMSFADLCLLLLGFFVLLHARADGSAAAASVRAAFGGEAKGAPRLDLSAADLFEPGEAVLRPVASRRLAGFGHALANGAARVRVAAHGSDATATARFDGWELAAARAAAVARAVAAGGVAARRIDIILPQGDDRAGPARLTVEG